MFQFPRFALKTLCIQVINNCFTPLLITQSVTITKYQLGCPIRRSLGIASILDFPKLIAEYHVLHRLLLPRHSPNALLALDLIQKEQDLRHAGNNKLVSNCSTLSKPKAYIFPPIL